MPFVSHALEWVRALLFGPSEPGGHATPDQPALVPAHAAPPSPEARSAMLVLACLCRTGRVPVPLDIQRDQYDAHPLVRAYVLQPAKRQHALSVRDLAGAGQ